MRLEQRLQALQGRDRVAVVGLALTAVWLLLIGLFWLFGPSGQDGVSGLMRLGTAVSVVLPLALIWMAVGLARNLATLRAEAEDLRETLIRLRPNGAPPAPQADFRGVRPVTSAPAVAPPRAAEAAPRQPASQPSLAARPADQRQTAMRFDSPESHAVSDDDLIRALNFPDGPDDRAGIDSLRAALRDHDHARLIRAAQDVVTLLASGDLYMDELRAAPADPDDWRRFAEGLRGERVAAIGEIGDPAMIEAAHEMMKRDEIFRDAAHHFLRHFDIAITRLVPALDDQGIAMLAETRSARAFRLLGRVAGIFG